MESVIIQTGISAKDFALIASIINNNPGRSLGELHIIASRVIKDINLIHGLVMGYLIGHVEGTEKTLSDIYQTNSICQRQN